MTPAGWTAEPWKLNKWGNVYSGKNIDNTLTVNGMALTSSLTKEAVANTQRIIACVNGCAGLNPMAYREVVEALQEVLDEHAYCKGCQASDKALEALAKAKLHA